MDTELMSRHEIEENSFLMFRQNHGSDYKRMVIYQALINIKEYDGIRLSRLVWELERSYQIPEQDVRAAVGALSGPYTMNAVSAALKKNCNDCFLRLKENALDWIEYFTVVEPKLRNFHPLRLNKV